MTDITKVLVVGGGIAGLVAAKLLGERGSDVDIVEINAEWTVYGVGIIQQSNVVRAMAQIGLLDKYLAHAFPFEEVRLYSSQGELQHTLAGERLAGEEYPANVGVSRLGLHKVLSEAAAGAGANIRLGLTLKSLRDNGAAVDVVFTDGSTGRYDLVIGADGIYSTVRELIFPGVARPRYTGQAGWRHNFPRPPEVDHMAAYAATAVGTAGLMPLSDESMYLFLTSQEPGNPRMPDERLHELMRERLAGFGGLIGELRDQITDPSQVVYKPFEVVELPSPWYSGRTILIGDAAHASTPHLGQGGGLAIEDAVVLVDELDKNSTVAAAFRAFMSRRFERCKYVQSTSLAVGENEMHPDPGFDHPRILREALVRTAQPI